MSEERRRQRQVGGRGLGLRISDRFPSDLGLKPAPGARRRGGGCLSRHAGRAGVAVGEVHMLQSVNDVMYAACCRDLEFMDLHFQQLQVFN